MRSVRLNFSKTGRAVYISHLDINRMMTRAVRRAGLPMWYTEGFNPHPYIAFALPLSLGQSSECEFMDIRLQDEMSDDEVKNRLNAVLPEGVKILSVGEPVFDAKEIGRAQYFVKLDFEDEMQAESFLKTSEKLLSGEEIIAEKSGKKGRRKVMKQINLVDYIYDAKLSSAQSVVNLQAVLAAGSTNNLNPTLLAETLEEAAGVKHRRIQIMRKRIITADGKSFK